MVFDIKQYLGNALYILRMNTIIIWSIILFGVISGLVEVLFPGEISTLIAIITALLKLAVFAVVYGMYYELIEDSYSSVADIGRKYIIPFIWLFLNMYIPALFLAFMPGLLVPGAQGDGVWVIIMMSFGILYLYVVPWFYVSGSWRGAIIFGVQFLFNNLNASTVIIMLALLTELAFICLGLVLKKLDGLGAIIHFSLNTGLFVAEFLINCIFFIVLVFIVKEVRGSESN